VSFITLDFETFYSDDVGFKKQTTEEYIRDPQFEVIGVAVSVDGGEPEWFSGGRHETKLWLSRFDWQDSAVLCHNAIFDGAILEWIFDIHPRFYYDTLCMARAIHGVDAGGSLAALTQRYQLGAKGTEVVDAIRKHRCDFSVDDLRRYGDYCRNDVALTFNLFTVLSMGFPDTEYSLIDLTIKMFTRPQLMVDDGLLVGRLEAIKTEKSELLQTLKSKLEVPDEEAVRKKLSSNPQFAEVLFQWGVHPPRKISPTTGKETWAFAKQDEGFLELTEHPDPFIQQLCAVRLGTKSTIEESRIERLIDIGARNKGNLPVPLKYYGAHTGRWAGSDKVNFQNLPSRDAKKKALKKAVIAPPGYLVVNCDSSQIEARVLAWLAGQEDVTSQFANSEDVYSVFASKIYKRPISKANPIERFVGKTCVLGLGYGTGADKLRRTLLTTPPGVEISAAEAKRNVDIYRTANFKIVELWRECDAALSAMMSGRDHGYVGQHECVYVGRTGIRLPNGLHIRYANLRMSDGKMVYDSRKGPVNIWGGAMVENIVQALARIIVGEQLVWADQAGYRAALTVHDAGVWVINEAEIEEAKRKIVEVMSLAPDWAKGLPVACELKYGETYGDC
jgi:DNA polymerase